MIARMKRGKKGGALRAVDVLPAAEEHIEQVSLCQWWALYSHSRGIPEYLLFAIPNGGRRDEVTGAKLKAEGVRAGIPDMFLAIPTKNEPGLFLELKKTRGGQVRGSQKKMHQDLSGAGYRVCVCRGWDEARQAIEKYLKDGEAVTSCNRLTDGR